jgi:hypothetical protein
MQDLPAWLQAFAALVALGISVWAVFRATSVEKRRDRLQARGIAVAIYPEILKLENTIPNVREALNTLKLRDRDLAGQSVSASVQLSARIEVPPMLDRNIDRLFMLGDVAGPACLQLVNVLNQYNALVDEIVARIAVMNVRVWTEAIDHLEQHIALLNSVVAKCKHEVASLHDTIKG